jgi:hypothetical protein
MMIAVTKPPAIVRMPMNCQSRIAMTIEDDGAAMEISETTVHIVDEESAGRHEGSSIYDVPAADAIFSPINLVKVFGLANYKRIPQLVADHAAKSLW